MSDDITTRLFTVNDPEHPHYLESGHLTGEVVMLLGKPMAKFALDHCRHGVDACFVVHGQLREELKPRSRRRRRK